MNKLTSPRVLLMVAGILLLVPFIVPIWQISIAAPQYPEGMGLKIWIHKITGEQPNDLQTLNGLNHYIGMKIISPDDIAELKYMPYIIAAFAGSLFLFCVRYSQKLLLAWLLLFSVAGLVGMYDFYNWEYDYGHNLNPNAPIKVPGMNYQPPLLGSKQLLNINATSLPDLGTYALVVAGGIVAWVLLQEKRKKNSPNGTATILAGVLLLSTMGCSNGPAPIEYGKDNCAECEMTITDKRFGAECITGKGKVLRFDSIECLVLFVKKNPKATEGNPEYYVTDFMNPGTLINSTEAFYTHDENIKSPMGENLAAFSKQIDGKRILGEKAGFYTWTSVMDIVKE